MANTLFNDGHASNPLFQLYLTEISHFFSEIMMDFLKKAPSRNLQNLPKIMSKFPDPLGRMNLHEVISGT